MVSKKAVCQLYVHEKTGVMENVKTSTGKRSKFLGKDDKPISCGQMGVLSKGTQRANSDEAQN